MLLDDDEWVKRRHGERGPGKKSGQSDQSFPTATSKSIAKKAAHRPKGSTKKVEEVAPLKTAEVVAEKHGVSPRTIKRDTNQLGRRNLTADQRSYIRGRIYERAKQRHGGQLSKKGSAQSEHSLKKTADVIAEKQGVSSATIRRDAKRYEAIEKLGRRTRPPWRLTRPTCPDTAHTCYNRNVYMYTFRVKTADICARLATHKPVWYT